MSRFPDGKPKDIVQSSQINPSSIRSSRSTIVFSPGTSSAFRVINPVNFNGISLRDAACLSVPLAYSGEKSPSTRKDFRFVESKSVSLQTWLTVRQQMTLRMRSAVGVTRHRFQTTNARCKRLEVSNPSARSEAVDEASSILSTCLLCVLLRKLAI
ncbi:AAEL009586-PA [Aedes aegypti]|uniref:AAEL009586-PA n=1 Tax=Aedes aegypti TaxID=7159 RepID=Q16VF1_AEDAE|nr:AAEL009586-PA [Aedes aegypti]